MKILESNNAQLTNYEVYQHLIAQQRRYRERPLGRQSGPGNLATLRREVRRTNRWKSPIRKRVTDANPCRF